MIQGSVGEFLGFQTAWSQPLFPCALSGCDLLISGLSIHYGTFPGRCNIQARRLTDQSSDEGSFSWPLIGRTFIAFSIHWPSDSSSVGSA